MLHNAIEAAFSLESPMWRTVLHMLYKPGRVAADYVSGMRRRYVNPLKSCFACGVLAAIIVQVWSMLRESRVVLTSDDVIMAQFSPWFHVVYFLSLPLLAVMLRAVNPKDGRTILESLVLCFFVYSQVFMLQMPVMPLVQYVQYGFSYLATAIGLSFLSWGAAQFYQGRAWLIAFIAVGVHLAHSAIIMFCVLVAGLVLQ